ncbi:unnamed protein product [Ectocarpus sp. 8 AP-2014]
MQRVFAGFGIRGANISSSSNNSSSNNSSKKEEVTWTMENQGDCAQDEEMKRRRPEALAIAAAAGKDQSDGNVDTGKAARVISLSPHDRALVAVKRATAAAETASAAADLAAAAAAAADAAPPGTASSAFAKTAADKTGHGGDPPVAPSPPSDAGDTVAGGKTVEERLATLHRAHIAALHLQEGASVANEALRQANLALQQENGAMVLESQVLRDEFTEALRDNHAWCQKNEVLGQEYTRAFLAKTAEVFDRNMELESENEKLRAENAELAHKAGKAERRHSEVIRETNAWRHENSVIHQEYAEHLASSAEILAENAALKDQIAVSNRECATMAAGGNTHTRKLTSKVKHVLGHNEDDPSGDVGTVGGGGGGGGGGSGVGDSFEGGASGIPNKQHRSPDSRVFFPSADGETPRRHTARTRGQEGHGQKGRLQQLQQLQQLRQLLQQERNEEAKAKAVSDARETLTKFSSTSTTADDEPVDRAIEAEGVDGQGRRGSRQGAADSRRSSGVASIGTDTGSVLSPSGTSSAAAKRREFIRKGSAETLVGRWSGSEPIVEGAPDTPATPLTLHQATYPKTDRLQTSKQGQQRPESKQQQDQQPQSKQQTRTSTQSQQGRSQQDTFSTVVSSEGLNSSTSKAWQRDNRVPKRGMWPPAAKAQPPQQAQTVDDGESRGNECEGEKKGGDADSIRQQERQEKRVLTLPQKLGLELEWRTRP